MLGKKFFTVKSKTLEIFILFLIVGNFCPYKIFGFLNFIKLCKEQKFYLKKEKKMDYATFKALQGSYSNNYNYNNYSSNYNNPYGAYNYNNYNSNSLFSSLATPGVTGSAAGVGSGILSGLAGNLFGNFSGFSKFGSKFLGILGSVGSFALNIFRGRQEADAVCADQGLNNPYCRAEVMAKNYLSSGVGTGAGIGCGILAAPFGPLASVGAGALCNWGATTLTDYLFDQTIDYMNNAQPAYYDLIN